MLNYAQSLKDSLKYTSLAKEAPNEEARKMLLDMAKQEIMHHAMLECLILDLDEKPAQTK